MRKSEILMNKPVYLGFFNTGIKYYINASVSV